MAEVHDYHARYPRSSITTRIRRYNWDLVYMSSIPGILNFIAWVSAFAALISKSFDNTASWRGAHWFLEFTVVTSCIALTLFIWLASLHMYRSVPVSDPVKHTVAMNFLMFGNSAVWGLLTLIAAWQTIEYVSHMPDDLWWAAGAALHPYRKYPLWATGVFVLLESFSLIGLTVLMVLDTFDIYKLKQPLFAGSAGKGVFSVVKV